MLRKFEIRNGVVEKAHLFNAYCAKRTWTNNALGRAAVTGLLFLIGIFYG